MKIAPDLYSQPMHRETCEQWPIVAKNCYRIRKLVANKTPRQMAKCHLLHELGRGVTEDNLLKGDSYNGDLYLKISYGPYCGPGPYGRMRVKMYGHKEEFFSMRELLAEIKKEKAQKSLF